MHVAILPTGGHDGGQDTFRSGYPPWLRAWDLDLLFVDPRTSFPQVRWVMDLSVFPVPSTQKPLAKRLFKAGLQRVVDELLGKLTGI